MLSGNISKNLEKLRFPYLVSAKFDGIRAISIDGIVLSRKLLPIPSLQVQEEFCMVDYIDGELMAGDIFAPNVYNLTQSHVMSVDKPYDLSYLIFDYCQPDWLKTPFYKRLEEAERLIKPFDVYTLVKHFEVNNIDELLEFEEQSLGMGAEGIMLRDPVGLYKYGRSTLNENILLKLKREQDDEGLLIDIEEKEENHNALEKDELGYAKRSSSKAGKVGAGMAGTFIVLFNNMHVRVAPGHFTHEQLVEIWDNKDAYINKAYVKFRHFPHGAKDAPRQARALGFRDKIDL